VANRTRSPVLNSMSALVSKAFSQKTVVFRIALNVDRGDGAEAFVNEGFTVDDRELQMLAYEKLSIIVSVLIFPKEIWNVFKVYLISVVSQL